VWNLQRFGRKRGDRVDIRDNDRRASIRYCFSVRLDVIKERLNIEVVKRKKWLSSIKSKPAARI
jgi:hypothetical protein